jgi:hypothetical protein
MLDYIDAWRDAPVWTPETIAESTRLWFAHLGRDDAQTARVGEEPGGGSDLQPIRAD